MEQNNNKTYSNPYSLYIRFSQDGYNLSVYDESDSLLSVKNSSSLLFSMAEDEIIRLLSRESELMVNYKNIRLICELDKYIFVPTAFFRSEDADSYLNLQHKLEKNERIAINKLEAWDSVNIFSIPNNLHQALKKLFPETIAEHHLSYFLTDKLIQRGSNSVQIWIRNSTMDVVVLKQGTLILINSYQYQTPEDFTYYTLSLFDQLSLDSESCPVRLFNSKNKPELPKLIQKYVKHCETINNPN